VRRSLVAPTPLDFPNRREQMEEDKWAHLPLERGDRWIRISDGEPVVVVKRLGGRVRYQFSNHGSMVTRIARFSRYYQPEPKHRRPVTGE
jgi:hypothetical protein